MSLALLAAILAAPAAAEPPRARLRDLGIAVGVRTPGPLNAITDVAGVKVGHATIVKGRGKLVPGKGPARTGVTAVLPHGGDLWKEKVPAGLFVLNGNGELTGAHWIETQGALEVPILLTNTMNTGRVADGVIDYMVKKHPKIGIADDVVIPVVAECDDSTLNDAQGRHAKAADAVRAIEGAAGGPVAEGAVGAGTGMIAYEFKAGIGTASRVLSKEEGGYVVGALVNANMGRREELTVAGVPVGREIPELPIKASEGSIIAVIATDAPLDALKLKRLAARGSLGLARTGATARHGSGDLFLAFSTGNRIPHYPKDFPYSLAVVDDNHLNPLFEAAAEAVEEAILNALTAAKTTEGRDGNTAYALPLDRLRAVLKKHGR